MYYGQERKRKIVVLDAKTSETAYCIIKCCMVFADFVIVYGFLDERSRTESRQQLKSPPMIRQWLNNSGREKKFFFSPYTFANASELFPHLPRTIIKRPLGSDTTLETEKETDLWMRIATPLAVLLSEEWYNCPTQPFRSLRWSDVLRCVSCRKEILAFKSLRW